MRAGPTEHAALACKTPSTSSNAPPLSTLLTLPELKAEVERLLALIELPPGKMPVCDPDAAASSGQYVSLDSHGYHHVVMDEDTEVDRFTTADLNELLYSAFEMLTFRLSEEYELANRQRRRDPRRISFPYQIQLLSRLSAEWAKLKETEQKEVLKQCPINDRLWGPRLNEAEIKQREAERATEIAAEAARRALRKERPFTADEEADIRVSVTRGYEHLKLEPGAISAQQTQQAIRDEIDAMLHRKKKATKKLTRELGVNLGCLWGQTICDPLGWHWCMVTADGADSYAIASANGSHFIEPMNFIFGQLTSPASGDNTSRLLFNMLQAGKLPPAEAGAYQRLG